MDAAGTCGHGHTTKFLKALENWYISNAIG